MRICLICGDYAADGPPGSGGGIESYVRIMSRGLARAGHEVHVIARAIDGSWSFDEDGVHVHALAVPDDWRERGPELGEARSALSFAWHAWRKLRALIATHGRFDVVEAPEYKAQGTFVAGDAELPLIVKCHAHLLLCLAMNGEGLTPGTALLADAERTVLQAARAVNANSRALAARCGDDYRLPKDRFAHVPYGIDTELFKPTGSHLRKRLGLEQARVALFVGRMEERKGISTLVRAFAGVAEAMPDAVLLLAGPDVNGPPAFDSNQAWMCAEWEALGVGSDRYLFLGTVPPAELPGLYSSADVMVAPSPFEAFGLVYLEAMACGCPPIGCRTGGAAEVIREGATGLLVPPDDAAALAEAMLCLLEDRELRAAMAQRGRELVARKYTLEALVDRTVRFYEKVVA